MLLWLPPKTLAESPKNNLMPHKQINPKPKALSEWRKWNSKGEVRTITFPSLWRANSIGKPQRLPTSQRSHFPASVCHSSIWFGRSSGWVIYKVVHPNPLQHACPATFWDGTSKGRAGPLGVRLRKDLSLSPDTLTQFKPHGAKGIVVSIWLERHSSVWY